MAMKDIVKVINKDKTFIAIQQEEGENDMYIIKLPFTEGTLGIINRPYSNANARVCLHYKWPIEGLDFNDFPTIFTDGLRGFCKENGLPFVEAYSIGGKMVSRNHYIQSLTNQALSLDNLADKMREQQ